MKGWLKCVLIILVLMNAAVSLKAQTDSVDAADHAEQNELLNILRADEKPVKLYIHNAFKSSIVINAHSIEMIGSGVLDVRILHRFGMIKGGYRELFGLDQAAMRMGFDYGIHKNFSIGIGRSTFNKEIDGFIKWRLIHQHKMVQPIPFSLVWVSGMTVSKKGDLSQHVNYFTNRLGFYHQCIVGRKFGEVFTLQLAPTFVHRNLVELNSDHNDIIAIGVGARYKLSNRTALILDAFPLLYGAKSNYNRMPLSIGFDIETGGHVFQLHLSNSRGMNEKAFITETTQRWEKGEFQIGFNISRVFTVVKNKQEGW